MSDVSDAEKRYADDSRIYEAKNNELTRAINVGSRKPNEKKVKELKDAMIDKRTQLYRTHNDYLWKLNELNFLDGLYVEKLQNLLIYHEEIQTLLNKNWFDEQFSFFSKGIYRFFRQQILEKIVAYGDPPRPSRNEIVSLVRNVDYRRCYDELCRTNGK